LPHYLRAEQCGNAEVIETICSLVDGVIECVGDTIHIANDIDIGVRYDDIRDDYMQYTRDTYTEHLRNIIAHEEMKKITNEAGTCCSQFYCVKLYCR
jgi:hypothetical protein